MVAEKLSMDGTGSGVTPAGTSYQAGTRRSRQRRVARQFLGRPASSAGVERMFSKAGKLHGDTKKSQDDATLQFSLLAAANSE